MIRRRKKGALRQYVIAGFLLLVMIWLLTQVADIARKEEIARKAAEDARRELERVEERAETLAANVAELETPRGREAGLRETFGVARPGEEVIIVIPENDGESYKALPWWRKMMGFFGL